MINFLLKWIIFSLLLLVVSWIVPGIEISTFTAALASTVVIALINTFIKPFVLFITLPINILTLGLFTLIVNALMIYLAAYIVPGFTISTISAALLGFILFSILSLFINWKSK